MALTVGVVQVVPAQALDGELAAVAAGPSAVPGVGWDVGVLLGHHGRGGEQLGADDRGVLGGVPVLDGGCVLVPVGEARLVLGQQLVHAAGEDAVHVADVAGVLEHRPDVGRRSRAHVGPAIGARRVQPS